ncbi:MAG: 30S ribosomal protein S6 [Bacilli bacterium]|nr:30S ribosomal protein S6 [Bacilli bacterium]
MRNYELMFVVRPTLEEEATLNVLANMKKILEEKNAKIVSEKNMGRRELAYEVKGFKNGNYFLLVVEATPEAVKEFDRVANINEDVIRHIVVRVD